MKKLMSFLKDEEGAFAIEYAVVAAVVALAFVVGGAILGTGLNNIFTDIGTSVDNKAVPVL